MNILTISSSQRDNSQSYELSKFIKNNILDKENDIENTILNLADYKFLLENYFTKHNNDEKLKEEKEEVLNILYNCDGVIIIAPEWGGMVPPALINLLLMTANGSASGLPLGHKPAFAIGVSASGGGNYPITFLKGFTAKNSHLTWIPLHAVVKNIEDFVKTEWTPNNKDRFSQTQSRLLVGIKSLIIYANKLKDVREELVSLSKVHPYGQ